ncbi:MAG: RnfABCDGE type electron transport complex subunit D [Clostridiales bacterium]|nr:RnfABCDGE type electron transport complex subunit D [Clostridiales bacterium]
MPQNKNPASNYLITSKPHMRSNITTQRLMLDVIIALLPALLVAIINFGARGTAVIAVSVISCVFFEWAYQKIMKKPVTINDFSAVITGILIAFGIPATVPLWTMVVAAFFAIVIVKQLFGGIGQNFVNPALAARAFLLAAYPALVTMYDFGLAYDAIAAPTPLVQFAEAPLYTPGFADMWNILWGFGQTRGAIGEVATILIIAGGAYLLIRKVINWRIPVFFIGSTAIMLLIFGRHGFMTGQPHYEIFLGALMLSAFFMATDYSTSPMTALGQVVFGIGCGVITAIIRLWGGFPEGVTYAILLMNLLVPLIDKLTKPRVYGAIKGGKT